MRFLAILFVTGFHAARYAGLNEIHCTYLFNPFKSPDLGVDLFFIISAYCLCISINKYKNGFEIFKKRLKKIILPYYIAILFWAVFVYAGFSSKSANLWDILTHLTFTHNLFSSTFFSICGVFWFLGTLIDFYILFLLFSKTIIKNSKFFLTVSILICFVIEFVFNFKDAPLTRSVFAMAPCFMAGVCLYKGELKNNLFMTIGLLILFFCPPLEFNTFVHCSRDIYAKVLSILIAAAIINLKIDFSKPVKDFIEWISKGSFSIYLYNYILDIFIKANDDVIWKKYYLTVLYILVIFGFGIFMYNLIEKQFSQNKCRAGFGAKIRPEEFYSSK